MNVWRTEAITAKPLDHRWSFAEIARTVGIGLRTLYDWRDKKKTLVCCTGRPSMTTGTWLLAAIERRGMPASIQNRREHSPRGQATRQIVDGGNIPNPSDLSRP